MVKEEAIIGYFEVQPRSQVFSLKMGGKSPGDDFVWGCTRDLVVYVPEWGLLVEKFRKIANDLGAANLNLQNMDVCLSVSLKPLKVAEIKSKV